MVMVVVLVAIVVIVRVAVLYIREANDLKGSSCFMSVKRLACERTKNTTMFKELEV